MISSLCSITQRHTTYSPSLTSGTKGADHTNCGYFFPSFINKIGHMDASGNSDVAGAKQSEEAKREQIKRDAKDAGVLDKHITEYPFTPKEAFLQHSSNIFPTASLMDWRNELMRSGCSSL